MDIATLATLASCALNIPEIDVVLFASHIKHELRGLESIYFMTKYSSL